MLIWIWLQITCEHGVGNLVWLFTDWGHSPADFFQCKRCGREMWR